MQQCQERTADLSLYPPPPPPRRPRATTATNPRPHQNDDYFANVVETSPLRCQCCFPPRPSVNTGISVVECRGGPPPHTHTPDRGRACGSEWACRGHLASRGSRVETQQTSSRPTACIDVDHCFPLGGCSIPNRDEDYVHVMVSTFFVSTRRTDVRMRGRAKTERGPGAVAQERDKPSKR